jgi:hypothetical protein
VSEGEHAFGLESACGRVHAPGCLGRPENDGRHDEHGDFRPGPGKVFGIGRFYDGHGYGHPRQAVSCQCLTCNRWEAQLNIDSLRAMGVVQMWRSGELGRERAGRAGGLLTGES